MLAEATIPEIGQMWRNKNTGTVVTILGVYGDKIRAAGCVDESGLLLYPHILVRRRARKRSVDKFIRSHELIDLTDLPYEDWGA